MNPHIDGGEGLKPCPFCGCLAHQHTFVTESLWSHKDAEWLSIGCSGDCDFTMQSEAQDELRARWNNRPAPPAHDPGPGEVEARHDCEAAKNGFDSSGCVFGYMQEKLKIANDTVVRLTENKTGLHKKPFEDMEAALQSSQAKIAELTVLHDGMAKDYLRNLSALQTAEANVAALRGALDRLEPLAANARARIATVIELEEAGTCTQTELGVARSDRDRALVALGRAALVHQGAEK